MQTAQHNGIHIDRGGAGAPLLLLLHGLGATAAIWAPLIDQVAARWPGRWLAPDLPGHGESDRLAAYRPADYAAALAPLVAGEGDLVILGHSLGGVIGLGLAGRADVAARAVLGLGIKVDWTDEELARFAGLSQREPRLFADRAAAEAHHAKACGLAGAAVRPHLLNRGVVAGEGGWRAALDMAAYAVEAPPMADLVAAAACPVHFACGSGDPMVSADRLRAFDPGAEAIPDAGHNAMVDDPGAIWDWLGRCC